jgi:parallel beta-helix repeat protein
MNSSSLEVLNNALMNVSLFGITLENSSHNTIQNCSIANSTSAFGLGASSENILAMNRIASTRQTSITLANSHGNTIESNSILDTRESGITLANSSGNAINGNSIAKSDLGILIVDSFANSLRDNRFEEVARSLYVESSRKEDYNNSIDESNLVDGKPIAYFYGASGKLIQNKELALLALAYCDKMTVKNIAITNDALFLFSSHDNKIMENNVSRCFGMLLMDSASNLISGNHLSDNSYSGIFLYSSDANQIDNNTASDNNQNGISLLGCSGNILRDNTAQHNSQTGIWLNFSNDNWLYQNNITDNPLGMEVIYSQGNYIVHNNFINNKEHARDTQGDNSWDLGNVTGGNYWSDHVAKGNPSRNWPRMIKGGKMDNFPFQDASGWDLAGPAAPVAGG